MTDVNRHKFYLVQILKDIYSDTELANCLGFKGGSALLFFYDLPRFSVDLDFDLLSVENEGYIYEKVKHIILKYGRIFDEAMKFYGPLIVLDYGVGERKLKIEISNRTFGSSYEIKNLLGINIRVMVEPDMFSHKLCALLDRSGITNRDIFDVWFFMKRNTPLNKHIVETRMKMLLTEYFDKCIHHLEAMNGRHLLDGLGDLMDIETKQFVKSRLLPDTIGLLKFYQKYPIVT